MIPDNISYLIHQELSGNIGKEDRERLFNWLKASDENQLKYNEFKSIWTAMGDYEPVFEINVEADFNLLQERILNPKKATQRPVSKQKNAPIHQISRRKWMTWAAAAIFLPIAFYSIFLLKSDPEIITFVTTDGEKKEILLPDGSKIWLNENAQIKYTSAFLEKHRSVELIGEAFFDVVRMPSKPFRVGTAHSTIQVLGTTFNVRVDPSSQNTAVTVVTGSVRLSDRNNDRSQLVLSPSQTGIHIVSSKQVQLRPINNLNAISWQNGRMSFKDEPLSSVFNTLQDHFDVEFVLQDLKIKDCPFSMGRQEAKLDKILKNIEDLLSVKIIQKGKQYIVSGGHC